MMYHMVPRLFIYQVEFPARTVAHLLLGVSIGFLLIINPFWPYSRVLPSQRLSSFSLVDVRPSALRYGPFGFKLDPIGPRECQPRSAVVQFLHRMLFVVG